jgi:hypothetical protein
MGSFSFFKYIFMIFTAHRVRITDLGCAVSIFGLVAVDSAHK